MLGKKYSCSASTPNLTVSNNRSNRNSEKNDRFLASPAIWDRKISTPSLHVNEDSPVDSLHVNEDSSVDSLHVNEWRLFLLKRMNTLEKNENYR